MEVIACSNSTSSAETSAEGASEENGINKIEISVPFATETTATIALNSLRIDKEPPRCKVEKELLVKGNVLVITLKSSEVKSLRASAGGFFESLLLIVKTIDMFKPNAVPNS